MKGKDFLKLINEIDEDLILDADKLHTKPGKDPSRWILAAACICTAVIIATAMISLFTLNEQGDKDRKMAGLTETTSEISQTEQTRESDEITKTDPVAELIIAGSEYPNENIEPETVPLGSQDNNAEMPETQNYEIREDPISYDPLADKPEPTSEPELTTDPEPEPAPATYRVVSIDQSFSEDAAAEEEDWEMFWNDGTWQYYMPAGAAYNTWVFYENGELESLSAALAAGHISVSDLDSHGIIYYKE